MASRPGEFGGIAFDLLFAAISWPVLTLLADAFTEWTWLTCVLAGLSLAIIAVIIMGEFPYRRKET